MRKSIALKKGDVIVIAVILLAALLWLAVLKWPERGGAQKLQTEIYLEGRLLQTVALTEEVQELRLESAAGYNVLQIGAEGVRVLEADCHNQDCVHAGWQNRAGGLIACLPHRLLILLSGEEEADFDAISR